MTDDLYTMLDEMQHEAESWQHDDDVLEAIDESVRRFGNRKKRLENCRKIHQTSFDGDTGRDGHILFLCGLPECPFCNAKRASKLETAVNRAIIEGSAVYMIHTDDADTISMVKRGGKNTYKSLPQADGSEVIFSTVCVVGSEEITEDEINTTNWAEYTVTPPGKRTSGALGKVHTIEHAENTKKIDRAVLIAETDQHDEILKATRETIEETKDLNPKTAEEVQDAIKQRVMLLARKLHEIGIESRITYRKYNLDLSCINWTGIRNNWHVNKEESRIEYHTQLSFTAN